MKLGARIVATGTDVSMIIICLVYGTAHTVRIGRAIVGTFSRDDDRKTMSEATHARPRLKDMTVSQKLVS